MRLIDADVVEDTLKKCVSNAYKRRDVQCAAGVSLAILQLKTFLLPMTLTRWLRNWKAIRL